MTQAGKQGSVWEKRARPILAADVSAAFAAGPRRFGALFVWMEKQHEQIRRARTRYDTQGQ